jgi:UDP-N-acetylglucosamine 2-epimerase (non-hydrolysing)
MKKKNRPRLGFIIGTRPEIIKMAPIILAAVKKGWGVETIFTGQHGQMAERLMQFFGIQPTVRLSVLKPGQTIASLSSRLLEQLEEQVDPKRIDALLVQGDTTSAWIGAYWGFTHGIRVGHVEAGLRTYDLKAPFPEEANRNLVSRLAHWHWTPTKQATRALLREGISNKAIHEVGNSGIDGMMLGLKKSKIKKVTPKPIRGRSMILVTAHRRENFGRGMQELCLAIKKILELEPKVHVLFPVHPNPQVRSVVYAQLSGHSRVELVEPLDYPEFLNALSDAKIILTDSGGVQEEAPSLGKRILVLRKSTERPEGVRAGFSKCVGMDGARIVREVCAILHSKSTKVKKKNPYGDGKTSARILSILNRDI